MTEGGGKAEFFLGFDPAGEDSTVVVGKAATGKTYALVIDETAVLFRQDDRRARLAALALASRKEGIVIDPKLNPLRQVATLAAFGRLGEAARFASSVMATFRPPLPAAVRDAPAIACRDLWGCDCRLCCGHTRIEHARQRANRTALLHVRRRAIRRNRAYLQKINKLPA